MPLLKEALSATNCNPRDLKTENSLKTRRAVVDWTGDTILGWGGQKNLDHPGISRPHPLVR